MNRIKAVLFICPFYVYTLYILTVYSVHYVFELYIVPSKTLWEPKESVYEIKLTPGLRNVIVKYEV